MDQMKKMIIFHHIICFIIQNLRWDREDKIYS